MTNIESAALFTALARATKGGGGVMGDAPERIWAYGRTGYSIEDGTWDNSEKPNCSQDWPHEKYIRADFVDAIIAATFDLAESKCAETFTMFENSNPNRPDVMPYIDDACEVCGDAIRALNTEETRTAILADAMKSSILKGQTDDT